MPTPFQMNWAPSGGEAVVLYGWSCFGRTTSMAETELEGWKQSLVRILHSHTVFIRDLIVFLHKNSQFLYAFVNYQNSNIYLYFIILSSFSTVFWEICWATHSIMSNVPQTWLCSSQQMYVISNDCNILASQSFFVNSLYMVFHNFLHCSIIDRFSVSTNLFPF